AVEIQDSAAPYHDWNERVTAECYAPNGAARRVDDKNRIVDIVDNFQKISFNVGPTLMAWLERHASGVHQRIVEADRASVQDVGDGIDPSRLYLWRGAGDRKLALFFYDGPISRAIAFAGALDRGERLVELLMGGFSDARDWPQIVHCATDGESYGHHHKFGEM